MITRLIWWPWTKLQSTLAAIAVRNQNLVQLERALRRGANPNAVVSITKTRQNKIRTERMLHHACEHPWPEGVVALLKSGANTEIRGGWRNGTPLFIAAERSNVPIIDALLARGANLRGKGYGIDFGELTEAMGLVGWPPPIGMAPVECDQTADKVLRDKADAELRAHLKRWMAIQEAREQETSLLHETPRPRGISKPAARLRS